MSNDARSAMLGSIRKNLRIGDGAANASPSPAEAWAAIPRDYRTNSTETPAALRHLFADRLRDYDAQILESSENDLPQSIATMLEKRGVSRILVPTGFVLERLPKGFHFLPDTGLSFDEINHCEGILTESTLAIAETGTIVLQTVPGQGRRAASLIPDYHLCLVDATTIVATVPEAIANLRARATLPTTFISGPSATADIEMTRIKGVHGPRFLDVILISKAPIR